MKSNAVIDGTEQIVVEWVNQKGDHQREVSASIEDARETAGRVLEALGSIYGAVQIRRQVFRFGGWNDAGPIEEVS